MSDHSLLFQRPSETDVDLQMHRRQAKVGQINCLREKVPNGISFEKDKVALK